LVDATDLKSVGFYTLASSSLAAGTMLSIIRYYSYYFSLM